MMSSDDEEANKESFEYMFKLTQQKNVRGLKKGICWCMPDIERTGSEAGRTSNGFVTTVFLPTPVLDGMPPSESRTISLVFRHESWMPAHS